MADKPLLATGAGMQHLVYYCATSGAHFKVLNGKEKGGSVNEIHSFFDGKEKKLESITK